MAVYISVGIRYLMTLSLVLSLSIILNFAFLAVLVGCRDARISASLVAERKAFLSASARARIASHEVKRGASLIALPAASTRDAAAKPPPSQLAAAAKRSAII